MIRMVSPNGGAMWVPDDRVKEYEGYGCTLPPPPSPAHPIKRGAAASESGQKKTAKRKK